ncbi:hypothetical protein, partial [Bacillus cereus]
MHGTLEKLDLKKVTGEFVTIKELIVIAKKEYKEEIEQKVLTKLYDKITAVTDGFMVDTHN